MTPHPRVVHVSQLGRHPGSVYIGRGACRACGDPGCGHDRHGAWGNPFVLDPAQPWLCMVRYLDMLAGLTAEHHAFIAEQLAGKVLGCFCRGRYPICHGDVLARLADGEPLEAIRADVCSFLGAPSMRCPACGGDGRRDPGNNDARACSSCGGTGEVDS